MKIDYCHYCFQTFKPNDGQSVLCTACNRTYHGQHYDGKCVYCSATAPSPYYPRSSSPLRAVIRKPVKLQHAQKEVLPPWNIGELFKQINSSVRMVISLLIGIGIATLIGAFAYRILNYAEFNNISTYTDSIFRGEFPPTNVFFNAFAASLIGAFVFFPVQLLDNEGNNSFQRRFIRLIAATVLLICLNILFFELNVSNLERFATDINSNQNFREIVLTIVAAQIGAIVTTFFLGFMVRRLNTPLTASGFPKWIKYLLSTARIIWHYFSCLAVVGFAFYITLISLPSYRTTSITLELGPQEVRTDTVQLGALAITFFMALLLYYPPNIAVCGRNGGFYESLVASLVWEVSY
jgi:uncharacterized membrane protein YwzB